MNLPTATTLDLGGGVKMEMVLVPVGVTSTRSFFAGDDALILLDLLTQALGLFEQGGALVTGQPRRNRRYAHTLRIPNVGNCWTISRTTNSRDRSSGRACRCRGS
jgi:hypothetical protein